ncbi:DNA segregation ATPase FtsK/SpoIIIE, S-DNA-T family [Rhizobium sp. RU35A]|uniref:DNA translocase FtsK n=1 Tax=Rhizobium sp. RU35A TaxID=1907414 RepID=UPI000956CB73|nr:DNA translocase FtsK [Rhizobium sp. RU35A]SIQ85737.1 DNA segregation ATPase FtsK/SpoIIIE, S-DNA-T family [Rhizobium sp. RU35A]
MHFYRTNFPKSESTQSEDGSYDPAGTAEDRRTPAVDPTQVVEEQAPWQAAFRLAPNVRFTRTPEAVIARPRTRDPIAPVAPEERMPAANGRLMEPVEMAGSVRSGEETLAPELLVNALQGVASAMQQPATPQAPKVKPEPSPRALIFKRPKKPDPVAETAAPDMPQPAAAQAEPQAIANTVSPAPVETAAPAAAGMSGAATASPVLQAAGLTPIFAESASVASVISAVSVPLAATVPAGPAVEPLATAEPVAAALPENPMTATVKPALPEQDMPAAAPASAMASALVTPKLWLSDFAFFEADFDGEMPLSLATPARKPEAAVTLPQAVLPRRPAEVVRLQHPLVPNSVTALYREVRPGTRYPRPVASALMPKMVMPSLQPAAAVAAAVSAPVPAPVEQPVSMIAPVAAEPLPAAAPEPVVPVMSPVAPVLETPACAPEAPAPAIEPQPVAPAAEPVTPIAPAQTVRTIVPMSRRRPEGLPGLSGALSVRDSDDAYEFPPISLLQEPYGQQAEAMQPDMLQQSAGLLESILEDFGVKGEIIDVRPGPVVTLYEFEPAPGVKSSRVIGLADDIARSMSALSARVAVVPGRNVIGIELPNAVREMVFFRELIECEDYWETKHRLPLCLGKTIGGEPVIAELAKMPHLLVAGTTGSGKSVAINTMILSLLYRLRPEECRLIMIDPKMLELSVYDGIPHLLTPVVTDPKKAVLALKWAVREMEDRYRKMSRLGVRNIDGYNARAAQAREKGETITVSVQTGFDRNTGEIVYEDQELDLSPMPYIVVVVDEMADLMMVAGKEIEGAIQRLAQMARAAGIHLIMATQRPSVDVITGTIKANFPTRISFQVTSKIDSRTILGEQGAEHLLGQGDMLHMAGGGRIMRVHGPFVSDAEVEHVVTHLKAQGRPDYLGNVTEDESDAEDEAESDAAVFDRTPMGAADDSDDLYEKAVKVVMKDRKCSTSYIQRRLSIGYNRAASLVERMEQEGLVGPANHVGKREIISGKGTGGQGDE